MKQKTKIILALILTLLLLVVSWAFWTFAFLDWSHARPAGKEVLKLVFSHPIFSGLNERDVGYYFFVLRELLIVLSVALIGAVTLSLMRSITASDRNKLLYSGVALCLCSQFMSFILLTFFPEYSLSTIVVYRKFGNDFTPKFSIQKFFRIEQGMKRSEVEAIIGRGRHGNVVAPGHEESLWIYSGQFSQTGWRFWIHFDPEGKVEKREVYWWND